MQSLRRRANRVYYGKYANAELALANHEGWGGGGENGNARRITRGGQTGKEENKGRDFPLCHLRI